MESNSEDDAEADLINYANEVKIPETVEYKGVKYTVTGIAKHALGCTLCHTVFFAKYNKKYRRKQSWLLSLIKTLNKIIMKKINLIILALILLQTNNILGQNWTLKNSGITTELNDVFTVNDNISFAVGDDGKILKTSNGGDTWSSLNSGTTLNLNSLYFTSNTIGYVIGRDGLILKTENGGNTWITQTSNTTKILYSIFFYNDNIGWICGDDGTIKRTTDGGNTWIDESISYNGCFTSVFFISPSIGYIVGCFANNDTYKTTDGGRNWNLVGTNPVGQLPKDIFFTDENTGYVVCPQGKIQKTTNGGVSWNVMFNEQAFHSIYFTNANNGWTVGVNGIFKTTDAGGSWSEDLNGNGVENLNGVHFFSNSVGFAVGNNGVIYKYESGQNNLSINPITATIPAITGTVSGSINVTSNIQWTAVSSENWLTFTSNSIVTGNGILDYKCVDNTSSNSRTATITFSGNGVANQTATITQQGTSITICGKLFQRFPQNNAVGMPQSMKFDWENSHIENSTYELDITTLTGSPIFNNANILNSEYQFEVGTFTYNQSYKWKVRALLNGSPITEWSDERIFTIKSESPSSPNYGSALGHLNNAVIYKNKNNYNGDWQCVEYVKRYHNKVYGLNMPAIGNANVYFKSDKLGVGKFSNRNSFIPQIGDLVCLSGGKYGHVAIVKDVEFSDDGNNNNDFVYIAQQNVGRNIGNHINQQVKLSYGSGKFYIHGFVGHSVQGWRRALPTVISPANNHFFNETNNFLVKWIKYPNSKKYKVYISKLNDATGCYEAIPGYNGATVYDSYYYFPSDLLEANSKYRFRVGVVTAFNGYVQTEPIYFEVGTINRSKNNDLFTNLTVKTQKMNASNLVDASNILIQTIYQNMYLDEGYTNENGILGFETAPALNIGDKIVASGAGVITQEVTLTEEMLNTGNVNIILQSEENYEYITDTKVEILNYQPIYTQNEVKLKITAKNHNSFRILDFENSNDTLTAYNEYEVSDSLVDFTLLNEGENEIYVRFIGADTVDIVKTLIYNPTPSPDDFNTVTVISDGNSLNSKMFVNGVYLKNITSSIENITVSQGAQEFIFMKEGYSNVFIMTDTTETINLSLATGIEKQLPIDKILVYPNPTKDLITVNLDSYSNSPIELKLFDAKGINVKTIKLASKNEIQINANDLTNGVYYLNIIVGNETVVTKKVIIMK